MEKLKVERLDFLNPVFRSGINVTVTKGDKWLHYAEHNTDVMLGKTDGPIVGAARIDRVERFTFSEIPYSYLHFEHDKSCQTLSGLFEAMKKAYGPKFRMDDVVIVIFFTPYDKVNTKS